MGKSCYEDSFGFSELFPVERVEHVVTSNQFAIVIACGRERETMATAWYCKISIVIIELGFSTPIQYLFGNVAPIPILYYSAGFAIVTQNLLINHLHK
jgi:hypothetical protein